jgi:hypothetical protein
MMFDRRLLQLKPLAERKHDIDLALIRRLEPAGPTASDGHWQTVARRVVEAKKSGAAVIMMMGGHVFRSGVQNYLIDLIERGFITHLATNGSGLIHDFEYALIGATTESVSRYIDEGQFGLWRETGLINDLVNRAYEQDKKAGMGVAIGRAIQEGDFPHKNISILAAAFRRRVPLTVHIGIGQDIIHEHPNCDGAATGALSYNDFLSFAAAVQNLENGLVMNFGSAVMAPEVFLKALSMARNVARQRQETIKCFMAVVCDLRALPAQYAQEPPKSDCNYYFRPWKTMLVRMTAGGGESLYFNGEHAATIPALWQALNNERK